MIAINTSLHFNGVQLIDVRTGGLSTNEEIDALFVLIQGRGNLGKSDLVSIH